MRCDAIRIGACSIYLAINAAIINTFKHQEEWEIRALDLSWIEATMNFFRRRSTRFSEEVEVQCKLTRHDSSGDTVSVNTDERSDGSHSPPPGDVGGTDVSVFSLFCKDCPNSPVYLGTTSDTLRHSVRKLSHQLWKNTQNTQKHGGAAVTDEFGLSPFAQHVMYSHCWQCNSEREVFAWWKEHVGVMLKTAKNEQCRTDGTLVRDKSVRVINSRHVGDKQKSAGADFPFRVSLVGPAEERVAIASHDRRSDCNKVTRQPSKLSLAVAAHAGQRRAAVV